MKFILQTPYFIIILKANSIILNSQHIYTTKAGASIRAYSAEDVIPGSNFSNAIVSEDDFIWLSAASGIVNMSGNKIEDFVSEYGIPLIRQLHYDRKQNSLCFIGAETLIKYEHQEIARYDSTGGFVMPRWTSKEVIAINFTNPESAQFTYLLASVGDSKDSLWH